MGEISMESSGVGIGDDDGDGNRRDDATSA